VLVIVHDCISLQKHSNFVHIACYEGNVDSIQHILANPPPLIESELKALFTAVDKVQTVYSSIHQAYGGAM